MLKLILLSILSVQASEPEPLLTPVVKIKANLTKSEQGFITNSSSYLKKSSDVDSVGNGEALGNFLYDEPNLDVTGGPRASAQLPQIRGLGSERTLILDEGVRQNFQSGHNGRVFSDFNLVREVEVIKGPWSSLYGSGALGGVVNFRRVQASDYAPKNMGSEVNSSYSSADDSFTQTLILYSNKSKLKPLLSVRNVDSNNIRLGSGKKLNYSSTDLKEYGLSLEYSPNANNEFTLKSMVHRNEARTPLNPTIDIDDLDRLGDNNFEKNDAVLTYKYKSKRLSLTAKPYFRQSNIKTEKVSDGRYDERKVETFGVDSWVNFKNTISENIILTSILGLEYFKDDNTGSRDGSSLGSFPNGTSEYISAYAQESFFINEKLEVSAGLRYDSFSSKDRNNNFTSNDGEELTGRSQVSYRFNDSNNVFIGFGQAFNAPRLQDIYITGLHFPGLPPFVPDNFFVPNPNLKPEKSSSYEVGYKAENLFDHLNLSASLFHTEADDFIARNVESTTTFFVNEDFVKLTGFELKASYKFNNKLKASLNYGQTRSRVVGDKSPLQDTLPDKWTLSLQYRPFDKLSIETVSQLFERQDHVPIGLEESPGYFLQNLFVSYKATEHLHFRLSLLNAFDREYVQHGNIIEGSGRNLQLLAKYIF